MEQEEGQEAGVDLIEEGGHIAEIYLLSTEDNQGVFHHMRDGHIAEAALQRGRGDINEVPHMTGIMIDTMLAFHQGGGEGVEADLHIIDSLTEEVALMIGDHIVKALEHTGDQLVEAPLLVEGPIVRVHLPMGDRREEDFIEELPPLTEDSGEFFHHMKLSGFVVKVQNHKEKEAKICLHQEEGVEEYYPRLWSQQQTKQNLFQRERVEVQRNHGR